MMSTRKKVKLISMRLTADQFRYLEDMIARVKILTGMRVTRTSVILRLLEYGLPAIEREFPKTYKTAEAQKLSDADRAHEEKQKTA
jgi:hypothetical protein